MNKNKLDVEQVEKELNCLVTSIGEIKRVGIGSYGYIPGLGDRTIFHLFQKWDDV